MGGLLRGWVQSYPQLVSMGVRGRACGILDAGRRPQKERESPMAVGRVVALGASNLTRGLGAVVSASRATFGSDVRIIAALGHGRSYGARSRWCFRTLPGILDSGLWRALEEAPEGETRALITDVGNDILYGFPVEQILEWVDEAASRLQH